MIILWRVVSFFYFQNGRVYFRIIIAFLMSIDIVKFNKNIVYSNKKINFFC